MWGKTGSPFWGRWACAVGPQPHMPWHLLTEQDAKGPQTAFGGTKSHRSRHKNVSDTLQRLKSASVMAVGRSNCKSNRVCRGLPPPRKLDAPRNCDLSDTISHTTTVFAALSAINGEPLVAVHRRPRPPSIPCPQRARDCGGIASTKLVPSWSIHRTNPEGHGGNLSQPKPWTFLHSLA